MNMQKRVWTRRGRVTAILLKFVPLPELRVRFLRSPMITVSLELRVRCYSKTITHLRFFPFKSSSWGSSTSIGILSRSPNARLLSKFCFSFLSIISFKVTCNWLSYSACRALLLLASLVIWTIFSSSAARTDDVVADLKFRSVLPSRVEEITAPIL